ncbi:MAG: 4-hydroxy-tetrahydrodipicolinate reductase [Cyclobacteriaceae bacterium]|nr:4-hydroxy-tetrahydrodipicolinate reductase [Cyclobacteriaceae bacterium]
MGLKIALLGYGKMGKAIEGFALKRGHSVVAKIDLNNANEIDQIKNADVAIEFSQPDAVVANLHACFDRNVPVVCGTTGWLGKSAEVEAYCKEKNGTFFYASNYSLGVNVFFKVNEFLARIMNQYPAYEVSIDEIHHTQKKDAPSGTAISLADGIVQQIDRKSKWTMGSPAEDEIQINSSRIDPTPGTHTVKYASAIDDIEIKHTAHSRDGFALGAVMVAEWLAGKKGIYTMSDFLKS